MAQKPKTLTNEDFMRCQSLVDDCLKACVKEIRETGDTILLQKGSFLPKDTACWLQSGKCVLSLDDSRGDTLSLFYFRPGQLVNFLPLLVKCVPIDPRLLKIKIPSHFFHVKALVDCHLYTINEEWFLNKFTQDPAISCLFLHASMYNLINSYLAVRNAPILSNTQRICKLIQASLDEENGQIIPAYLTQAEISRHLSIHSITVTKIFGKFRKIGLIKKTGQQLEVANPALLQALADGQEKITY